LYIFDRSTILDHEYIATFSESKNDPETGEMMPRKLPSNAEYIKRLVAQDLLFLKLPGSVSRTPSTTTGLVFALRKILPTKSYWKDLKMREAMREREKTGRLPISLKIKAWKEPTANQTQGDVDRADKRLRRGSHFKPRTRRVLTEVISNDFMSVERRESTVHSLREVSSSTFSED
jgi:hypothetical protein